MKKVLFLIVLILGSLIFVTIKDLNHEEQVYTQQSITEETLPVEESVGWSPPANVDVDAVSPVYDNLEAGVDPNATYTANEDTSNNIKDAKEYNKKSGLSSVIKNIFKNTPKDVVTDSLKAMINNDIDLFIKCNSMQDLEEYARKKDLTVDQVIAETKQIFEESSRDMQKPNIKLSDFKISQPDDYKSRDHVYVKVQYIGSVKDSKEFFEVPVHREYDKNWYLDQD
jgi:hypothetical protein